MKNRFLFVFRIACVLHMFFSENGFYCTASTSGMQEDFSQVNSETCEKSGCKFPINFYNLNSDSYENKDWYKERNEGSDRKNHSLLKDREHLHIFAFNVQQANCIILRKGSEAVIIDAGYGGSLAWMNKTRNIIPKIKTVLDGSTLKAIFITHPHKDHFNLFLPRKDKSLFLNPEPYFSETTPAKVFLGGPKYYWSNEEDVPENCTARGSDLKKIKNFLKVLKSSDIKYITTTNTINESDLQELISDVIFDIITPETKNQCDTGNKLSLIIKVTYRGHSILFTGDAEQYNFDELTKASEKTKKNKKTKKDENKEKLKNPDIVFLPHHGSNTEDSDQWMTDIYSLNPKELITWFINSSPEGQDGLPECDTIEGYIKKLREHSNHNIKHGLVCRNPILKKSGGHKIYNTTRPLYMTGTAPGGVYWLRIPSDKGGIELYNANQNSGEGWEELNKQDEETKDPKSGNLSLNPPNSSFQKKLKQRLKNSSKQSERETSTVKKSQKKRDQFLSNKRLLIQSKESSDQLNSESENKDSEIKYEPPYPRREKRNKKKDPNPKHESKRTRKL